MARLSPEKLSVNVVRFAVMSTQRPWAFMLEFEGGQTASIPPSRTAKHPPFCLLPSSSAVKYSLPLPLLRRGDRVDECARLESVCIARYRGFESLPLRHFCFSTRDENPRVRPPTGRRLHVSCGSESKRAAIPPSPPLLFCLGAWLTWLRRNPDKPATVLPCLLLPVATYTVGPSLGS